ncbi:MAG: hydrolase [Thiohalophilus sp.]|uniref:hydrolase n=1 Tax=Thiohalophilus sp. TaxID=3028392 RepID=UPI0028706DE5|nr:hydrolase [Thiohalophilus sp.]MDR9436478.1 hydrolase [Thiohalophilus sp.]
MSQSQASSLSAFTPARGLGNPHVQTLLPRFINRRPLDVTWQELPLPDGDFVDLAWRNKPAADSRTPIVAVFHGLEGSICSPYARDILRAIEQCGWHGVLMHFRGCSGRINRLPRSYHSGETGDARYFLSWLRQQYPHASLAAVGYSLGGNMLLKLQAEWGGESPLRAAVSVSAPLKLDICADRINQGFSKVYERHLVKSLVTKVLAKFSNHDYEQLIGLTPRQIENARTFRQFDNRYTAPIHGFADANDYYRQSSAYDYLGDIRQPALIVQAYDDPFMTPAILPDPQQLPDNVGLAVSPCGGHVGFVSGSVLRPHYWLTEAVPDYLARFL